MTIESGKTALITGASSGIGEAFARALAARGARLILVARSEEKLRALATDLAERHGIRAEVLAVDLSRPEAGKELFAVTQGLGLAVDLLVNNAGFGTYGPFERQDVEREGQEVQLNVAAWLTSRTASCRPCSRAARAPSSTSPPPPPSSPSPT